MLNRKLRRPLVGLAAIALAGSAYVATSVNANAASTLADPSFAPSALSADLDAKFAGKAAGSFVKDGKVIVNVTDKETAAEVRAAGATPRMVTNSAATLAAADATLKAELTTVGTSFAMNPETNKIEVHADESVTGSKLASVKGIVAKLGGAASVTSIPGKIQLFISGGDAIYAGSSRCSLGFNVKNSAGQDYFVTAGHCTRSSATWTNGSATLGTRTASSFPGNDYGVVRYTNTSIAKQGTVGSAEINNSGTPAVGTRVTRRGSTTGIHSGTVNALNATVNYAEGSVTGLIRTNVCAQPGDSGGSLYSGTTANGLTSGGSGNCTSGGTTYFQPVVEVLNAYGLSVF